MDRKDIKLLHGAKRSDVHHKMIDVKDIRTHPTFAKLLRIDPVMLQEITQSMRCQGFFSSDPIVLGTWPGQDGPVVIDGSPLRSRPHTLSAVITGKWTGSGRSAGRVGPKSRNLY